MTQAKGNGLETFEWKRYAWTGRVVRTEDRTGRRDVTDQESEPATAMVGARFVRRTSRHAQSAIAIRVAQ